VDDTEYNIFNTDRRLQALRSIAEKLATINEKKSLIYFSSGMDRTGIENQSQLRSATNAAVRPSMAIYTMDIRGLQALVPGGEAQNASLRGTSPYSGKSVAGQFDSMPPRRKRWSRWPATPAGARFSTPTISARCLPACSRTLRCTTCSAITARIRAGRRFRRITVRVNRPGVKIDFRRGYYAPADFQHSTRDDRERQLDEELASDLPTTDLPVYLSAAYFRIADRKFYVPVSVVVPGSQIPFTHNNDQDHATLDVLGIVTDPEKRPVGQIRDTVNWR
jgi:hypothetical protein